MPFHESAADIEVSDGHILKARLKNMDGEEVDAEFDLNSCIGNNDGSFEWGGEGFAGSAEDISFSLEGDDSVPVLRASLKNAEGELVDADINLGERIHNNDGCFEFM
ncbi:Cyanovirin-N [Parathielavia hyrcaniae]|uniref:Cyanovirin-N n=1 Tax=Parathielavia hyrcaniae TaxID=113614 RepID=A0AAN6Q871_9PEZI|nr:Cyanovirin-N [Parathielavia hyrcaniae]